jgi:hypothetical protein
MSQQIMQFVAVTSGGRAYEVDFPLHPETRSPSSVSDLVTGLLAVISDHAGARDDVTDGDVLQALAMTTAIRGRMLEGRPEQIEGLTRQLSDSAWEAVRDAKSYAAARA